MIYRGPGFLAVAWFGSSLTPSPLLSSVGSSDDTQEDWERETSCWRESEEGIRLEPKHTTVRKPAWSSINQSILSGDKGQRRQFN
jgi:hypothetical protein